MDFSFSVREHDLFEDVAVGRSGDGRAADGVGVSQFGDGRTQIEDLLRLESTLPLPELSPMKILDSSRSMSNWTLPFGSEKPSRGIVLTTLCVLMSKMLISVPFDIDIL